MLLGSGLSVFAQPKASFDKTMHEFGTILWKNPVTATFKITNKGDKPLVISNVTTSCGCTVTDWTKSPILPGKTGEVSSTFDAKALGRFRKSIGVYCNASDKPVYLSFRGEVTADPKNYTFTHPYQIGAIRLNKEEIEFDDANRGDKPTIELLIANTSDRVYTPVLMHLPPYLQTKVDPNVLQKGEKGVITLTLNSERLTGLGLTQTSVYLSRFSGDKVGDENEIPVSAILLPDFSGMTEVEKANAPAISLSTKEVDMSAILAKKSKARQDITITNTGRSPLQINKLQVFHPAVGVNLKKSVLQPGESTRLRVTVVKKNIGKKRRHLRLLMITNDPMQPKVEINIKAKQ